MPHNAPMHSDVPPIPTLTSEAVRTMLRAREEIALLAVREEDPFARQHPLFAAQMGAGRLELDAPWRLPRRDVTIAVYDDGEGLAQPAAQRLREMGYTRIHLLADGLEGWRRSGGELFQDVNAPSKAFGELVEHEVHTPSLSATEVKALLALKAMTSRPSARRRAWIEELLLGSAVSTGADQASPSTERESFTASA